MLVLLQETYATLEIYLKRYGASKHSKNIQYWVVPAFSYNKAWFHSQLDSPDLSL